MIQTLVCLLLLGSSQLSVETFKREMAPLQSEADKLIADTGATLLTKSKAGLIEGYGVVVSLEVALEPPSNPLFPGSTPTAQVKANVARRQKDVKDKVGAMVRQRVASLESVGPAESLAIVVHIFNSNPAEVPNLPRQFVFSAKKAAPQQLLFREF